MDNNQIVKYIKETIASSEPIVDNPRLESELRQFTDAICLQKTQLERTPTTEQIRQAWENWKTERFTYINNIKANAEFNLVHFKELARKHVLDKEKDVESNEVDKFASTFAERLKHLGKQPSTEHIQIAWENWKNGYK